MKLDIGCGGKKKTGFVGVDQFSMCGVDVVFKIGAEKWPFPDNSIIEAYSSNFLEHLTNLNGANERIHFFNELFRVMQVGAKALVTVPHWNSERYYGDPTHKEPFSEMGVYYLNKEWRMREAPHTDIKWNPSGYQCDFDSSLGYVMHHDLRTLKHEDQQYAMKWHRSAVMELQLHLIKR